MGLDGRVQAERFGQHHHGQRLATAGGVPDHAARPFAIGIDPGDPLQGGFDGKVLLVAGDLFDPVIKDDKLIDQLQEALGAQQIDQGAILGGGQPFTRGVQVVKIAAHPVPLVAMVVKLPLFGGGQRRVDQLL